MHAILRLENSWKDKHKCKNATEIYLVFFFVNTRGDKIKLIRIFGYTDFKKIVKQSIQCKAMHTNICR